MNALLVAVCAAAVAVGVLVVVSAWSLAPPEPRAQARLVAVDAAGLVGGAAATLVAGLVAFAATGWVVGGVAGAAGGWVAVGAWSCRGVGRRDEQARIEALASWCEQLRDLLSADNGVQGTIAASVATCPTALRPEVGRLSTRLARQSPEVAMREFAREVDDPSGDLIANVLLLAMSHSGRTAELLSELAIKIRDTSAMRLRVEADRSGQRAEARFVIVLAVVVVVAIVIFARGSSFLDAYDTATGQVVLALVAGAYGGALWWISRLTRFDRPARFLSLHRPGED